MYVISNGHNYIMKRKGGRICATCDINLALQFESKGLAICEINKLPAGYKNGHYAPKSMDEATIAGKSPNITAPAVKPAQGYQLMAELKRARRKRREAKDAKFLLEIIMNEEDKGWGDGRLETAIEQLGNRKFTPKIRNDLFEKN